MNRKDIIRVFMDADGHMNDFNGGIEISWDNLVKGAMQLIEAEREACARVAESYEPRCDTCPSGVSNAIRARGQS